jgi:signal transduction histidine kinase
MRAVRYLVLPFGLVALVLTVPVIRELPGTTYGGTYLPLLVLETLAAVALLLVCSLDRSARRCGAVALAGSTWLVPELAGWLSGSAELRTAADAWSRLLPAVILVGVLPPRAGTGFRWVGAVALAGGAAAAGARLGLIDPFLDVRCWRTCDRNPLLIAAGSPGALLEGGGVLLMGAAAVAAGVLGLHWARRNRAVRSVPIAAALCGLVLGSMFPGALRLAVTEAAASPAYQACFVLAQVGAIGLATVLARDRFGQWLLGVRLTRLAGTLPSASAGSVATALRQAVSDPDLRVLYWAPARDAYVDADGAAADPHALADRRVTVVARRGKPVAALTHSSTIDGERLDRALGAALRLALENGQLRAATLAELRELRVSRARIVERADDERRRLERNLHDGAQQRVVSLALLVRMLGNRARDNGTAALAGRAEALTRATVAELRRVARGIYPAVLADAGLAGAILELAESSTDLPVCVQAVPAGRYPGTAETTAYLVVASAVADARERHATCVTMSASARDETLTIDVRDDAPSPSRHPVTDLADQIAALAGRLQVEPGPDATRIRLELPCGS